MKELALHIFHSNSELLSYASKSTSLQSVQQRRSAVKIAVIDDEAFLPQTALQSYGYSVTPLGDIKNVIEVASYHMVLCDILGVGRHFDANAGGASLIAEIKNEYPEKVVVAYTGGTPSDKSNRIINDRADALISKDVDMDDWVAKLDELSKDAVDPHIIWNKVRARFVSLDVDTKQILLLEDAYVRSIFSKESGLTTLQRTAMGSGVRADARAIIQGLVSNAIFKIIVGG